MNKGKSVKEMIQGDSDDEFEQESSEFQSEERMNEETPDVMTTCTTLKKKRRKRKKNSVQNANTNNSSQDSTLNENKSQIKLNTIPEQDNSHLRKIKNWPEIKDTPQNIDFTLPVEYVFNGKFPVGEELQYNSDNFGSAKCSRVERLLEKKEAERVRECEYNDLRKAAECHRTVRRYIQRIIKPGMKMIDICQLLESKVKSLIIANKLLCGHGFPTGCSLNNCAAHYTPNYGDDTVLQKGDICKLDFGVQVNGRIIDCAFSVAFEDHFDNLIQATIDGTNEGIRNAGIDARLSEISERIEEAISCYEMELNGKIFKIKPVKNLTGHSIGLYQIHEGKSVPIVKTMTDEIMEENELYAIETFASTGKGYVSNGLGCSHYMKNYDASFRPLRVKSAKQLLQLIDTNFGTLAFCRRWIDDLGMKQHLAGLKNLVENDIVVPYPPLCDIPGCFTSQTEHTILLRPTCKEVLSRGFDY